VGVQPLPHSFDSRQLDSEFVGQYVELQQAQTVELAGRIARGISVVNELPRQMKQRTVLGAFCRLINVRDIAEAAIIGVCDCYGPAGSSWIPNKFLPDMTEALSVAAESKRPVRQKRRVARVLPSPSM
jgi:hypothetical protein